MIRGPAEPRGFWSDRMADYKARMKDKYRQDVVPALTKRFGYANRMMVPKLTKIVINIGLSEAKDDVKILDGAMQELSAITSLLNREKLFSIPMWIHYPGPMSPPGTAITST